MSLPPLPDRMVEPLPVFVYGTLKRGEERAEMWPREPVKVDEATVRGRLLDLGPYPALTDGDDVVAGELWHLRPEDVEITLRVLDEIECFGQDDVDLYVREVVECTLADGDTQRAYAYFIYNLANVVGARVVQPGASGSCRWGRG